MDSLEQIVARRLRSGATVLIVQEADEELALGLIKTVCESFADPENVKDVSATNREVQNLLEAHPEAKPNSVLILRDFLAVFEAALTTRMIREVALQRRKQDEKPSILILIEQPMTKIPPALSSDVEIIRSPLPDVEALRQELDGFLEASPKAVLEGEKEEVARAVAGLARHEASRLYARCYVENGNKLDPVWLRSEKARRVTQRLGGALTFESSEAADVGGLEGLRSWLDARLPAFTSQDARDFGLPIPKGVLLLGVPGVGKSLLARFIARRWGLPLMRLDVGRLFGSLVGQSEMQARMAIEAFEACAPCVGWIDEIEKGLSNSGGDGGTSTRVFGAILTWLQDKKSPVFVVGTANKVAALPPELLRKGRFDELFFCDLPNALERREIFNIHLKRRNRVLPQTGDVDPVSILAEATDKYSGAEIEQLIIEALFLAYQDGQRDLRHEDVLRVRKMTKPLSDTMKDEIKALQVWAEGRTRLASASPEKSEALPRRRGPQEN